MEKNKVPLWAPVLVMVAAVLLVTVGTGGTDAAKGGHGGSITVPDGVYGGTTVATVNPGGTEAWVYAECFQGGLLALVQYRKVDSNNQAMLELGPTDVWTGGDADCTADEIVKGNNGRWRSIASTTFHVSGS